MGSEMCIRDRSNDPSLSNNGYFSSIQPEYRIFEARIVLLKDKKETDLNKIETDVLEGKIDLEEGIRRNDKIKNRYELQKSKI